MHVIWFEFTSINSAVSELPFSLQLTPKHVRPLHNAHPPARSVVPPSQLHGIQFRRARGRQTYSGTTDRVTVSMRGRCERLQCLNSVVWTEKKTTNRWTLKQHEGSWLSSPSQWMRAGSRTNDRMNLDIARTSCATGERRVWPLEIISETDSLVRMYQWRMWPRLTLTKRGGWSRRRCHASCPAVKRATLAAHSSAPLHREGEHIPGALLELPGQVCVWRPAGGSMRWAAPDHLPGQLAAVHAAAHHLQQPHRGAAATCAQLPFRSSVPGLQQQFPDGDIRVHVWESKEAGLPGPLLQHLDPDRGQDIRALGEPGDAEDDRQPGALGDPPGRVCRSRGPPGAGRE